VHSAARVGDEARLLSRTAPTWVCADRWAGASAACASATPPSVLLMDDGLQHPTLHRDLSLLVVDAEHLLGNGRVLPAGPLREPFHRSLARADAVVALSPPADAASRSLGAPPWTHIPATRLARGRRDAAVLRRRHALVSLLAALVSPRPLARLRTDGPMLPPAPDAGLALSACPLRSRAALRVQLAAAAPPPARDASPARAPPPGRRAEPTRLGRARGCLHRHGAAAALLPDSAPSCR